MPPSIKIASLCMGGLCMVVGVVLAADPGPRYGGRVLYRGTKVPASGVLVEIVEARDNGEPTDGVLGHVRTATDGCFAVVLSERTNKPVTLVVSAVRTSAESGGDRSEEGYDLKTHQMRLTYLPHPSATKPNVVFVERRKPGRKSEPADN